MIWVPPPLAATLSLSPLWKIPLLLPCTHLAVLGMTPPNPRPTEEERARFEGSGKSEDMPIVMEVSRRLSYARDVSSVALFGHIPRLSGVCEGPVLHRRIVRDRSRPPALPPRTHR